MVDIPATMALAVKNTKLIGTTSVASNIFIAWLRNLWRDIFWRSLMNTMTLVTGTLCSSLFIHHNTVGGLRVQCHHVQYVIFFSLLRSWNGKIECSLWWEREISAIRVWKREKSRYRKRKPWLTWSGRRRRRPWQRPWRRRWDRWAVGDLLSTLWSSPTRLWLRWLSERLQQHRNKKIPGNKQPLTT